MKATWQAYSGTGEIVLVAVLAAVTVVLAVVAVRLRRPIPGPTASLGAVLLVVVAWLLAIVTFLADLVVYAVQAHEVHLVLPADRGPIAPVTFTAAGVSFVVVAVVTRARLRTRLGNAFFAACAGPMVFELPFDLVVMGRTTHIPPAPGLYIALFFLPLFLVEILTFVLVLTRPGARVGRWTFGLLAGMFGVFAVWGLAGFSFPFPGVPLAANVVSKVLSFAVVVSLFVRRDVLTAERGPGAAEDPGPAPVVSRAARRRPARRSPRAADPG